MSEGPIIDSNPFFGYERVTTVLNQLIVDATSEGRSPAAFFHLIEAVVGFQRAAAAAIVKAHSTDLLRVRESYIAEGLLERESLVRGFVAGLASRGTSDARSVPSSAQIVRNRRSAQPAPGFPARPPTAAAFPARAPTAPGVFRSRSAPRGSMSTQARGSPASGACTPASRRVPAIILAA